MFQLSKQNFPPHIVSCRIMILSILPILLRISSLIRINWWKIPAESLDLNPIENMWHELKEFSRREVMPKTKQELIDGIVQFLETMC